MLQTLKYIVLFLLGYKVIKELFKEEKITPRRQVPKDRVNADPKVSQAPNSSRSYPDAELIDYEEVK